MPTACSRLAYVLSFRSSAAVSDSAKKIAASMSSGWRRESCPIASRYASTRAFCGRRSASDVQLRHGFDVRAFALRLRADGASTLDRGEPQFHLLRRARADGERVGPLAHRDAPLRHRARRIGLQRAVEGGDGRHRTRTSAAATPPDRTAAAPPSRMTSRSAPCRDVRCGAWDAHDPGRAPQAQPEAQAVRTR